MSEQEIDVYIEQNLECVLEESWFRNIARRVLDAEDIALPVEIGLVITNTETVWQLNRTYRGKDEPTDVLAFPMFSQSEQERKLSFVAPPDGICHLGEVVISYPQAVQQAGKQGHGIEQELALLTVHGVLHLLGYDHEQFEEEQCMRAREVEILRGLYSARDKK